MWYKLQLYALTTNYVVWLLVVMVPADLECVVTCHQSQVWAELHVMLESGEYGDVGQQRTGPCSHQPPEKINETHRRHSLQIGAALNITQPARATAETVNSS